MTLHGEYDDGNIFAKILDKEADAVIVHEDDDTLTFMDVFPQSRGHVLVVPKTRARNMLDIDPAALQALIARVQKAAQAVEKALKPDGVFIAQFNGAEAGQTVYHLHFHVIPRYKAHELGRHGEGKADEAELREIADRIRDELDALS